MKKDIIVLEDVYKVYESPAGNVVALRGISIQIQNNDIVCVMGPSGSGKTTMMNIISGIDKPSAGKVIVDNRELNRMDEKELLEFRRKNIGYIFQNFNLVPTLTALENVMLPRLILGENLSRSEKVAKELLKSVGLEGKEYRYPEELSGGEQQRVSVAVSLANDPKIIIADEPTGELDIENAEKVIKLLLEQQKRGKTVIITTHDPRVARMTNRILILEDGIIKGEYSPHRIDYGISGAIQEVDVEKSILEFLEKRINEISQEIERIVGGFRKGEIPLRDFISKYNKLEILKNAYLEEVNRIGMIKKGEL